MEKKMPSFLKICASSCYFSENMLLQSIQALTPLFTDLLGTHLHDRTFKYHYLFESLTETVSEFSILKHVPE